MAISRMSLLKNKKVNSIKLQKRQVAELLQQQKDESARIKVENLIREDYTIEALDILELFCDLLQTRLQLIVESKACPHDLKEAISTLIYAAPRIEVPELSIVRTQIGLKFGKEFVESAMENKDLAVNQRVMFKLSVKVPEPYLCVQYLKEIAKEFNIEWDDSNAIQGVDQIAQLSQPLPQQQPVQFMPPQPLIPQQGMQPQQPVDMTGFQQAFMPQHQQGPTLPGYQATGFDPSMQMFSNPQTNTIPPSLIPFTAQQTSSNVPASDVDSPTYDFDELQKRFEALKKRE